MKKENSNIILYVLVFLAIGFSFVSLVRPAQIVKTIETSVGAVSGPEISSPFLSVNGVTRFYNREKTANLTKSVLCSIKSPSATSTLVNSAIRISGGNTADSVTTVYKSATAYATTTQLYGVGTILAGAQGTIASASTTINYIISPSQYIVFDTSANYAQTGYCNATFEVI